MKTTKRAIIVPPMHEIVLGIAQKQCDLVAGNTYELAPHCSLWARGAKHARIKRIYCDDQGTPTRASVAPIIAGSEVKGTYYVLLTHFR